jgi:hypothetical protein
MPRTAEYGTCKQNPYPAVGILSSACYGASRGRAAAFYLGRQHCQNHFSKCRPRRVSYIPSKLGYILPPEKSSSHLLESSGRILPPRNVGFCYSKSHLKRNPLQMALDHLKNAFDVFSTYFSLEIRLKCVRNTFENNVLCGRKSVNKGLEHFKIRLIIV